MSFFESIILGIVQGITEFLPVSSSAHLWIFEELVFQKNSNLALEAFLHFATLLAVVIFFRKKLWSLCRGLFSSQKDRVFVGKLALATACTVIVALFLKPFLESELTKNVVIITLLVTGILVFFSDKYSLSSIKNFSWKTALILGIVQGVAVIPGISRSGITIALLLFLGFERKKAVEISFLLSIPVILGAFVFLFSDLTSANFSAPTLFFSATAACVSAIFAIWGMLQYIEKYWKYFALWCFGVAGMLLTFS